MGCPDANVLQELADGTLDPAARATILAHADECVDCHELLAALARDQVPGDQPARDQVPGDQSAAVPAPRRTALVAPGTMIGRYCVEKLLGAGGLGVVYAAHDPELGRRVALKLLRSSPGAGQERLLREARALARLSHPNVVAVFDVASWEDRVVVAMELIAGRDLRAWLAAQPRAWPEVVDVFVAAGRGLAAAHAAGLIHRDFKPENVLLGEDGRVCVTDFGLARVTGEVSLTAAPTSRDPLDVALIGTPAYMAPEQHRGHADAASDQFAFCAALHEALYGERPFDGATYADLRRAVLTGKPRPPAASAASKVPASLRRIVARGLAAEPRDRWPSLPALLGALGRDRARRPRRIAEVAGALLAIWAVAFAADGLLRDREAAVTRASFGAAHRSIERALAARLKSFGTLAEVSARLPDGAGPLQRTSAPIPDGMQVRRAGAGLEVVFARRLRDGLTFTERVPARDLLAELASENLVLELRTADGRDGDVAEELAVAAERGAGEMVPVRGEGGLWLVEAAPLAGLAPGTPPALLVLAEKTQAGLAGLFPSAHRALRWAGVALLALLVGSLWSWRRHARRQTEPRPSQRGHFT